MACAVSALAILPAPTYRLWQVAIVVTEWGHVLAIAPVLVALVGRRSRRISVLLALTAALLCTPLVRAWRVARVERLDVAWAALAPFGRPATCVPDVLTYVDRGDWRGRLDFYRPLRYGSAPLVLVIHGGSWQSGERGEFPDANCALHDAGYAVADVDYRLAPAHKFPAAHDDIVAALAYLIERRETLGIDEGRVALLGRSAGAQLALDVAYRSGPPEVRAVVALYGPADLIYGYEHPASPLVMDSPGVLTAYVGGTPAENAEAFRAASPYFAVGPATPPTLLVHGSRDELVRVAQSRRLADRLREAGRMVRFLELPWATHACDYLSGPCSLIVRSAVAEFLGAAFR